MGDFSSSDRNGSSETGTNHAGASGAAQSSQSSAGDSGHFYDAYDYDDGLVHSHDWAVTSAHR